MCHEKFQTIGADRLLYARNLRELQDTKDHSCYLCSVRNLSIECSQCRIHQTAVCLAAIFSDSEHLTNT